MVVRDICGTLSVMLHSTTDKNSITFFIFQSAIVAMYKKQALEHLTELIKVS